MGALQFLDLVIGLVFIYFLLSLICVSLQELKANLYNQRSENLKKWVYDTFNGKDNPNGLGAKLWNNIIIDGMTQEGVSASYIPKEVFVSALFDEIYYGSDDSKTKTCAKCDKEILDENSINREPYDFYSLLEAINNPAVNLPRPLQRVIKQIHSESHQNLETFKMRLERWFEMAMERNAGTYKKKVQRFTFYAAILVTVLLNVDSIQLATYFYDHPGEARRIADQAETYIRKTEELRKNEDNDVKETVNAIQADIKKLNELKLPIGWEGFTKKGFVSFFSLLVGWTITAFAVSLGAPFWFDTLNKLVNIRAAGKMPNGGYAPPPSDSSSKDNQPAVG